MTIDLRTRTDGAPEPIDPGTVLDGQLPTLLADRPELGGTTQHLRLRPLTLHIDDRSWTLRATDAALVIEAGATATDERHAEVVLTADQLRDLVTDQVTPIGLMTAGTLDQPVGRIGSLLDWWLVLRSLFDGTEIYRPGTIDLPADLHRTFDLDSEHDAAASFLDQAGFVHLRGVFDPSEMAAISADMDVAAPQYHEGDGRSWWAGLDSGERRLVRMQGFEHHSPAMTSLLSDERLLRLGTLGRSGHHHQKADDNRIEALFKPLGITVGISDVPWHKDCSLGRHSYDCSFLTLGISVTGAGPGSGQLRMIAGSHRALIWPSLLDVTELGLPDVALPTEAGDVTVHLSCTLHMAEPPTQQERRVLYTSFGLPRLDPAAAAAAAVAERRLLDLARERAPLTTSQPPAPPT